MTAEDMTMTTAIDTLTTELAEQYNIEHVSRELRENISFRYQQHLDGVTLPRGDWETYAESDARSMAQEIGADCQVIAREDWSFRRL